MNPSSIGYLRPIAGFFLALVWLLPGLGELWQALLPTAIPFSLPAVGITDAGRTEIALIALAALFFSGYRPSKENPQDIFWALFLLQGIFSSLKGGDSLGSLFFMSSWLAGVAVVLAAPRIWPESQAQLAQNPLLHFGLILVCLFSLAKGAEAALDFRLAGPFILPGALASWLLLALPLAMASLLEVSPKNKSLLPLAILSTSLALCALIFTVSRAAWFAALIEIYALVILSCEKKLAPVLGWALYQSLALVALIKVRSLLPPLGLLLGFLLLSLIPILCLSLQKKLRPQALLKLLLAISLALAMSLSLAKLRPEIGLQTLTQTRLAELNQSRDSSTYARLELWKAAINLSLEHPLLGVGPGRYGESYPLVQKEYYLYSDSAHGLLLEIAAETGLIGLALFLVALGLSLKKAKLSPYPKPQQLAPLVGLLIGGAYAQLEVSSQYAAFYTTAAFLVASLMPSAVDKEKAAPCWWLAPLIASLLWVLPSQRSYQEAKLQKEAHKAYTLHRAVSDRLPAWGQADLAALALGIKSSQPSKSLEPLIIRAQTYASKDAVTYQMAGEVYLDTKRYKLAQQSFSKALSLDRFNRPGIYHGLFKVADYYADKAYLKEITTQVLATYDLKNSWQLTHQGHRKALLIELIPLLTDIADRLNPIEHPRLVEPIYRFLIQENSQPRYLYGLGLALLAQNKKEEALPYIKKAHALDPKLYQLKPPILFVPPERDKLSF